MNLRLPSGAVVTVAEPSVRALLCGDGSRAALIDAVWAHEMDATRLSEADADFIATWCIRRAADDREAEALATVCAVFGETPSHRIGITDPSLAFECDAAMALLFRRKTRGWAGENEETDDDHGRVRFSVPDPNGDA